MVHYLLIKMTNRIAFYSNKKDHIIIMIGPNWQGDLFDTCQFEFFKLKSPNFFFVVLYNVLKWHSSLIDPKT
jgi:hypothetical protein